MDLPTFLIGVSLVLLSLEFWAFIRLRQARRLIGEGPGHDIALVLYRAMVAVILVQVAISLRSLALDLAPRNPWHGWIAILDITSQLVIIGAIVWAVLELADDD